MINPDIQSRVLALYPLLADLPAADRDRLFANATYMKVPDGALMFDENQPCMGFPLLISGSARVIKSSPSGRDLYLYQVLPGETCILTSSCLLANSPYQARGVVQEELELVVLPPGSFKQLFGQLEQFRNQVFNRFSERLTELMNLVTAVAFQKLDQRLAALLISRPSPVELTHQAMADELGSFRELVSRLLKDFENRGWVRLERGQVCVLDAASLKKLVNF
ncbi:Crp/Fnr family transcriptional regulator [Silvimonas iriomotensis]|uniref:Cyclic nucleotide-binding protein n=1 Tax=Silvimonas iriomotensis TaxID=449662 RepID=A0ABQ2PB85_9NEIS|nr:Crp/Fnr family transcriptional regulator [Silvimonas iriomotensis]GGP22359.1 cyclic nucleotide-binding protein [Silvimonas iriomotensis]